MAVSVYQIANRVNGKSYIGITTKSLEKRWNTHVKENAGFAIHNALRKYGKDGFDFLLLEEVKSWQEACEKEKAYIKSFNTKSPYGYNLTNGGEGILGLEGCVPWNKGKFLSFEHRRNLSLAHIGIQEGENNPFYGKHHTDKSKQMIRDTHKGNTYNLGREFSEEHRENLSISHMGLQNHKGYEHTEETKERIRKKKIGQTHTQETKDLMVKSHTGLKHTEEAKANMRAAWIIRKLKTKKGGSSYEHCI